MPFTSSNINNQYIDAGKPHLNKNKSPFTSSKIRITTLLLADCT